MLNSPLTSAPTRSALAAGLCLGAATLSNDLPSSLPARFCCGWSPTFAAGSPLPWASLCSCPPISGSSWPSAPTAQGSSPLLPARQPAEARPIHRRQPVRRHTTLRPEHREHSRHRGPGGCRGIASRPRRPAMVPCRRATPPPAGHARGAGTAGGIAAPRRDLQLHAHRAALSRLRHTLRRPAAGRRAGQPATPMVPRPGRRAARDPGRRAAGADDAAGDDAAGARNCRRARRWRRRLLPRGNDGVGMVGAFVNEAPDHLRHSIAELTDTVAQLNARVGNAARQLHPRPVLAPVRDRVQPPGLRSHLRGGSGCSSTASR